MRALFLAKGDSLRIRIDGGKETVLSGHVLPPLAQGSRTYRSKVGGTVSVLTITDKQDGRASFFSLGVRGTCRAGHCGHGGCNTTSGVCLCEIGYDGAGCSQERCAGKTCSSHGTCDKATWACRCGVAGSG